MTAPVMTDPIGLFPGKPAPDDTWFLRDRPWPTVGELVEVCYARRNVSTKELLPYVFGRARCTLTTPDGGSEWEMKDGTLLVFNPDFWRPIAETSD